MNSRSLTRLLSALLVVLPASVRTQTPVARPGAPTAAPVQPAESRPPREFPEFRGTWILDESAGKGHIAGIPVARTLMIATTPTEISLVKDSSAPEVYSFDGIETPHDAGGVTLGFSFRFTLVADALALTTRRTRNGGSLTNVVTDAYTVADNALTIERQLSVVQQPPGILVTLADPRSNRQTIVYRRETQAPAR
jgi:hypothetical protein